MRSLSEPAPVKRGRKLQPGGKSGHLQTQFTGGSYESRADSLS